MKGHAVANGVYVAAANRIGLEQYLPDTAEFSFGIFLYCGTTRRNFGASLTRQRRNLNCRSRFRLTRKCASELAIFRDRRIDAFGDITKRAID
jgi:N-carbamoylputrescine amidase